jgi:hypothetical protein
MNNCGRKLFPSQPTPTSQHKSDPQDVDGSVRAVIEKDEVGVHTDGLRGTVNRQQWANRDGRALMGISGH